MSLRRRFMMPADPVTRSAHGLPIAAVLFSAHHEARRNAGGVEAA
jgi:hypothetical protein